MPSSFVKDPDAILDYSVDWAQWLAASPVDTIQTSSFAVIDGGTLSVQTDTTSTTRATVWLQGGTVGESYRVTNTITTAAGRTAERTITLNIVER